MPSDKIFNIDDINHLIEQNCNDDFAPRNAALIACGVSWGLTLLEASGLRNKDVIDPSGEFYTVWQLPKHIAFNGEPRELQSRDNLIPFLDRYIDFKTARSLQKSNTFDYKGLDGDASFFVNDKGLPFAIDVRDGKSHARGIMTQYKKMIGRTNLYGATPSSFRDSFINLMHENGLNYVELMKVTGIRQKKTLDRIIRPHEKELSQVINKAFSRVILPKHLFLD